MKAKEQEGGERVIAEEEKDDLFWSFLRDFVLCGRIDRVVWKMRELEEEKKI